MGVTAFTLGEKDFVTFPRAPTLVVGRSKELESISGVLTEMWSTPSSKLPPRVISVAGISGSGKTTICTNALSACSALKGTIVCSGKFEMNAGQGRPFGALLNCLDDFVEQSLCGMMSLSEISSAISEHVDVRVVQTLLRLIPRLHVVFPSHSGVMSKTSHLTDISGMQTLVADLYAGVTGLFQALTPRDGMLVINLDDVQWAASDSCELISRICTDYRETKLVLVASYRSNEVDESHPWMATVKQLRPECLNLLDVSCLDRDATIEMIVDCLSVPDQSLIQQEFLEVVWRRSGGNPFLVCENVGFCCSERSLRFDFEVERWLFDQECSQWTDASADTVVLGLAGQDADLVRILGFAACIGNQTDAAMLAVCLGEPIVAVVEEQLSRCVLLGSFFLVYGLIKNSDRIHGACTKSGPGGYFRFHA